MVRNSAATLSVEGWLYKTSVINSTVRIRHVVIPQRSSYQTENRVISLPRRLPCTKRLYRKSGSRVTDEHKSSSSMDRSLLSLGLLLSGRNLRRASLLPLRHRLIGRLLPSNNFCGLRDPVERGQEVGEVDVGKNQRCKPEQMLMGKESQQTEH